MHPMSMNLTLVLQELQAAHLIHASREPDSTFLFNHVLTQETAYGLLLVKGRRSLHLRVAAAFEQVYADRLDEYVPMLAYHYWWGEDWPLAARYARRAGARAMRVYALREAIGYFAQALQALDKTAGASGPETCDVILDWSQAAFGFEPFPKLLEQLERAEQIARQLADKRRLAMALLTIGRVHLASGHPTRAIPRLVECYALARELGDDQIAVIPTYCMGMVTFDSDPQGSLPFFDRAAELARRYGNVDMEAYALATKAMVDARLGEAGDCRQCMEQALEVLGRATSPVTDSEVFMYAGWSYLDLGDLPQALEYARRGVEKAISADNLECACFGFACLGFGHLRVGHLTEAEQAFKEAIRRSEVSGAEEAQLMAEAGLGMAHFSAGHAEGLQELLQTLGHSRRIGNEYVSALLEQTLGEIHLRRDEIEQAITYFNGALEYYRPRGMRPYLTGTLELLAEAFERQGDRVKADQARDEQSQAQQGLTRPG